MASIAVWVGEKFAGGIVGGGGSAVFSEIMSLVAPGSNPDVEINRKLDDIVTQLNTLHQSVLQIQESVSALQSELQVDTQEIETQIAEQQCADAARAIETMFGEVGTDVTDSPETLVGMLEAAQARGPVGNAAARSLSE